MLFASCFALAAVLPAPMSPRPAFTLLFHPMKMSSCMLGILLSSLFGACEEVDGSISGASLDCISSNQLGWKNTLNTN